MHILGNENHHHQFCISLCHQLECWQGYIRLLRLVPGLSWPLLAALKGQLQVAQLNLTAADLSSHSQLARFYVAILILLPVCNDFWLCYLDCHLLKNFINSSHKMETRLIMFTLMETSLVMEKQHVLFLLFPFCMCVCVLEIQHCEDQSTLLTNRLRTFWLVLTFTHNFNIKFEGLGN